MKPLPMGIACWTLSAVLIATPLQAQSPGAPEHSSGKTTGKQANQLPWPYCQDSPGFPRQPPYPGTGTNRPCNLPPAVPEPVPSGGGSECGAHTSSTVCVRGYTADEILCGDVKQFRRGDLLNARNTEEQELVSYSITDDARTWGKTVDKFMTREFRLYKELWYPKPYPYAFNVRLDVTIDRCQNVSRVTKVLYWAASGKIEQIGAEPWKFVRIKPDAPELTGFVDRAVKATWSLNNPPDKNGTLRFPLPYNAPVKGIKRTFYFTNWSAASYPGASRDPRSGESP